jgi:hypothetical protein
MNSDSRSGSLGRYAHARHIHCKSSGRSGWPHYGQPCCRWNTPWSSPLLGLGIHFDLRAAASRISNKLKGQLIVDVPEGEKDVETLEALGFVATTTNAEGALRWTEEHTAQLVAAGVKAVRLWADKRH